VKREERVERRVGAEDRGDAVERLCLEQPRGRRLDPVRGPVWRAAEDAGAASARSALVTAAGSGSPAARNSGRSARRSGFGVPSGSDGAANAGGTAERARGAPA
jgi:hypothetical protein